MAHSSLLTVTVHRNFGLPLGRFPSIFISTSARMFSVSSHLLLMCPNHSNLLLLITIAVGSTLASSKISSFLRCSNRLTPIAHRTILNENGVMGNESHICCCQVTEQMAYIMSSLIFLFSSSLSRHLGSQQWSLMVPRHRLLSPTICVSSTTTSMSVHSIRPPCPRSSSSS